MDYIYACPQCASIIDTYSEKQYDNVYCDYCEELVKPIRSLKNTEYYYDEAIKIFPPEEEGITGDFGENRFGEIVLEEIKNNPLFDEEKFNKRIIEEKQIVKNRSDELHSRFIQKINSNSNSNTPKCPTCGSTKISKISVTSKVAGAAMFGFFSKTAKSQFRCSNCGYKW